VAVMAVCHFAEKPLRVKAATEGGLPPQAIELAYMLYFCPNFGH
jgi:hypothetical protein